VLNISVTGTLPEFQLPQSLMEQLSVVLGEDIRNDVASGGNPTWKPRIFGDAARLGYITRTLRTSFGENYAQASFGGNVYARGHELGWARMKTPAMRRAMWARLREQGFVWNGVTKPVLVIPQRSATSGIFARKQKYVDWLGKNITITHHVPIGR
jgi:phage gpG-like protein